MIVSQPATTVTIWVNVPAAAITDAFFHRFHIDGHAGRRGKRNIGNGTEHVAVGGTGATGSGQVGSGNAGYGSGYAGTGGALAQDIQQFAKGVKLSANGVGNGRCFTESNQRFPDNGFQDGDNAGQLALRGLIGVGEVITERYPPIAGAYRPALCSSDGAWTPVSLTSKIGIPALYPKTDFQIALGLPLDNVYIILV